MLTYQEALDYIYSFVDYERSSLEGPRRFDLSRITALLKLLGQPHRRYKAVHIAGTKGKGSTAAMIESILRAAGYKTGLFTSPHLHTYRERIQTGGQLITEKRLVAHVERLMPLAERFSGLTTFEITTALAFSHFAQEKVEWAILETGLGGRLDTTNVVDPAVVVITLIGYDHVDVLGHRLSQIAFEKAGIIKEGRPVVSMPQRPTALRVIKRVCRERRAPLTLAGRDWTWKRKGFDLKGQKLDVHCHKKPNGGSSSLCRDYANLSIPFLGAHQLVNTTTVVATMAELARQGVSLSPQNVVAGLETTFWPGRVEVLNEEPLLVVDGAHNLESTEALAQALKEYFDFQRLILIFGALHGHDFEAMLRQLLPLADQVFVTQSLHPRAIDANILAQQVNALGHRCQMEPQVDKALWKALRQAEKADLVCAAGSLSIAAEARAAWLESQGISFERDPPPA
ncbi:MAG TPA: bifunctional folylpolyglutamate synthase/dihydrofolate synthase [Chloroflexi bacterium]|nr:bifunctional folylpolyglutamate synthase/dihydrofolate synthase [Chloroflexota bacterium]